MRRASGKSDTICALATPVGIGSIAVIRISGPGTFAILDQVFDGARPSCQPSHTVRLGWLLDHRANRGKPPVIPEERSLDTRHSTIAVRIDQVMLAVFRKPGSYTGEDMAEVSCHGGTLVADVALDLLKRHGCRQAEPGEFARRALLAGKLSLSQAEATFDLINARSPAALRDALERYKGGLSRLVARLSEELRELHAEAEYLLSFDEGDAVKEKVKRRNRQSKAGTRGFTMLDRIRRLARRLDTVVEKAEKARYLHDGVRVAIVGRPNVGKSSLFNCLLGDDRAMVLPLPGTTRDRVEATTMFSDLPVVLTDTAGLAHPARRSSLVNRLAEEQTQKAVEQADLVLAVFDGSRPATAADRAVMRAVAGRPTVFVVNKTDKPGWTEPAFLNGHPRVWVSALFGRNVGRLKAAVSRRFRASDTTFAAGARHAELFRECRDALGRSLAAADLETRTLELSAALAALDRVDDPGRDAGALDRIFARFCVGK